MALFQPPYANDELVRFTTEENYEKYYQTLVNKSVACEYRLNFGDFRNELSWMYKRGWEGVMSIQGHVCETLCREVVANFSIDESVPLELGENEPNGPVMPRIVTFVRSRRMTITPQVLTARYGIGIVNPALAGDEPYEYADHELTYYTNPEDYIGLLGVLLKPGNVWPESGRVAMSALKDEYFLIMYATFHNILPLKRESEVDSKRALLIYAISHHWRIDLATYMFDVIYSKMMRPRNQQSIPFGITLSSLAIGYLPQAVRDTLTFTDEFLEINRATVNRSRAHIVGSRSRGRAGPRGGRIGDASVGADIPGPSRTRGGRRRVRARAQRDDDDDDDIDSAPAQSDAAEYDLQQEMMQIRATQIQMQEAQIAFRHDVMSRLDDIAQWQRDSDARAAEYQRLIMEQFQSFHPYGHPPHPPPPQ